MKKQVIVLVMAQLFILGVMQESFAVGIVWEDIGRENLDLRRVLVHPDNPQIIYIGSNKGILNTEDGGETWKNIFSVRGQNKAVNFLLFDPKSKDALYVATGDGIFYTSNQGKSWKRIFQGKNSLENECTTIAALAETIYVGTKAGFFVSQDTGRSWHRERGIVGKSNILAIAYHPGQPDYIYVACVDGVFRTQNKGASWEEIFVTHSTEEQPDSDLEEESEEGREQRSSQIRYITLDSGNSNSLYLATSRGIYRSQDRGNAWEAMSSYGLLSQDIRFLLCSAKSELYAVTKSAVFVYTQERWEELSFGLPATDIRSLALDSRNNLYAACDRGLFKTQISSNSNRHENAIALYFQDEPDIHAVQEAAIKYAEVEPEKIIQWRNKAAKKALLPQFSVGIDRNSTDLWHWEGGSTTKTNDDILRRGRDSVDWDVSLSWDLGELIWNNDQTSIDVRSRLMVQLRDDILDEATKLYFERIRVKMEIDNLSIEDSKRRLEKELKLKELTAYLDALTGGYFSQHLGTHPN